MCRSWPFPPVVVSSSGCSRRMWLESEGVGWGVQVVATSSDFGEFLRLQSEDVTGVGGCGPVHTLRTIHRGPLFGGT